MLRTLACASCGQECDPRALASLCNSCGRSLTAKYSVSGLAAAFASGAIHSRTRSMWRYAEVLPADSERPPVSLGEGWTPLLEVPRLGAHFGLKRLFVKDESANPTGSFKARGMSAAVTAARDRGARVLAAPSAGNAAGALSAYAARAGLAARVFLPEAAPPPNRAECRLFGANTSTIPGSISDSAAALGRAREAAGEEAGWFDLSTLKEPYRLDGKKTMGYELFEQFDRALPDVILYPTGGGTGLLGMMKAFDELREMELLGASGPRMIAVQSDRADSIVRAFHSGAEESAAVHGEPTIASGLQVPRAFADWWVLRDVRRSGGTAMAVSDEAMLEAIELAARLEGLLFCPEGAALVAALPHLLAREALGPDERIVLFNTASGYKYPETLAPYL